MGITVASLRSAISTDTGEQNFTTSDMGGLTPSAAMFLLPRATADGTAADHAAMGIGFATATDAQGFATWTDGHGVGTSVTTKRQSDSNCIGLNTPGDSDSGAESLGEFIGFISDGVTVNWIDASPSSNLMSVALFGGTDLSAHVGVQALSNTENASYDITACGFEPDLVIAGFATRLNPADAAFDAAIGGLGFVQNDGSWRYALSGMVSPPRPHNDGQRGDVYRNLWANGSQYCLRARLGIKVSRLRRRRVYGNCKECGSEQQLPILFGAEFRWCGRCKSRNR